MNELTIDTWMKVLVELLNENSARSISNLAKKVDITYSHLSSTIIPLLKNKGFLNLEFEGRQNHIVLTAKGREAAKLTKRLFELLKEDK